MQANSRDLAAQSFSRGRLANNALKLFGQSGTHQATFNAQPFTLNVSPLKILKTLHCIAGGFIAAGAALRHKIGFPLCDLLDQIQGPYGSARQP